MRRTYRSDLSEEGYKDWAAPNSLECFAGLSVASLPITNRRLMGLISVKVGYDIPCRHFPSLASKHFAKSASKETTADPKKDEKGNASELLLLSIEVH
jgi:hypothetical protein